LAGLYSQQWSKTLADVLATECALDEKEQEQNLQKGLTARISDAACSSPTIASFACPGTRLHR